MRVDIVNKICELYKADNVKHTAQTGKSSFSDMLEISQAGKDYQVAKPIVAKAPDVREELVKDIKERMESGTYNVSVEDVADKLLRKAEE